MSYFVSFHIVFLQVIKKYVSVARVMKDYEEVKYAQWRENLESTLMTYLKRNLLVKVVATPASVKQHGLGDEEKAEKTSIDEGEVASLATAGSGMEREMMIKAVSTYCKKFF